MAISNPYEAWKIERCELYLRDLLLELKPLVTSASTSKTLSNCVMPSLIMCWVILNSTIIRERVHRNEIKKWMLCSMKLGMLMKKGKT